VQKSTLLRALQQEILRHDFSYFVDQPPSIAQGRRGVVVPGCPACQKRINTMNQFLDRPAEDAMPALIEKFSETKTECTGQPNAIEVAVRRRAFRPASPFPANGLIAGGEMAQRRHRSPKRKPKKDHTWKLVVVGLAPVTSSDSSNS